MRFITVFFVVAGLSGLCNAQTSSDPAQQLGPSTRCGSDFQSGSVTPCKPKVSASGPAPTVATPAPTVRLPAAPVASTVRSGTSTAATAVVGGVSEKDIDDHLASWGKPSRQAIRAVLNPTDENIIEMRRKNQADLAMSSYIANRASQIDSSTSAIKVESLGGTEAPALNRMKVILYAPLKCGTCDQMFSALQALAVQAPMLDASIAVTSPASEKDIIVELARLGLTLPVRTSQSNELARLAKKPPFLHIVDAKNQLEGTIPASATADEIKVAIISYRKSNDDRLAKKDTPR